MSNGHKNFEDRLKDRLLNEELQYEVGAWESFQKLTNGSGISNIEEYKSQKNKNKRWGFWTWALFFIGFAVISVFAGQWGFNQVFDNKSLSGEAIISEGNLGTQNYNQISNNKTNSTQIENNSNPKTSNLEKEGFTQKTNTLSAVDNGLNNYKFILSKEQNAFNSIDENGNGKNNNEYKVETIIPHSQLPQSSANHDKPDVLENFEEVQIDKTLNLEDSPDFPFINTEVNSTPSSVTGLQMSSSSPSNSNNLIATDDKLLEDRKISIATIDPADVQDFTLPVSLIYNKDMFIEPLKYKKNEFYFGAGYANRFSEFKVENGNQKVPNYLSLGYFRKMSPSWSLGVELNLTHIQGIPMSREINDYHLTSTSFEFITGTMTHRHTNYAGSTMMLKFQPLGSGFGVYGGINVAYAIVTQTSFQNDVEGENTVIEELRVFHTGSEFYKKWDYGLVAGASLKIWKGFELEGRAVFGLADVSDNYYWGEGRNTTTHYRLGLKYRFL